MPSLREIAERALFGDTLEDKLWAPDPAEIHDRAPGPALSRAPPAPGRPRRWTMGDAQVGGGLPTRALHDPRVRCGLVHAFANHELQAIELMALALLSFTDAPASFRRGVAAALREEQAHLRAYLARLTALGGDAIERPASGFFWRVMAPMPSPVDFVAHLSLTFEQANLDFARHYASALRSIDPETAAVLDTVGAEEIGHVKLGLRWFRRWVDTGPSLLRAHAAVLRAPITLRRARGIGFFREARVQAGLPADYIAELAAFEASRGRTPIVHAFDPTAELRLGQGARWTPDADMRARIRDLEVVASLLAGRDDVVLVSRPPTLPFVQTWQSVGIAMPQLAPVDPDAPVDIAPARLRALQPWGWCEHVRRRLAALAPKVAGTAWPPAQTDRARASKATWIDLRARIVADEAAWLDEPDTFGVVATDVATVIEHATKCLAIGYPTVVVKAAFGTAGRNALRIIDARPEPSQLRWIERTLVEQGAVVVEPWLPRVCDLSLRIDVAADGSTRLVDIGRFVADLRGQFLGAVLGPITHAVPPAIARFFHADGTDSGRLQRVAKRVAAIVGERLHALGHTGPAAIDAFVYRDRAGALRLRPLVEVNARPTFGHVATALSRRVARGRAGMWLIVARRDLPDADVAGWLERLHAIAPLTTAGDPPRIVDGALPTTDPSHAERVISIALVAGDLDTIVARLHATAPLLATRIRGALA